MSVEDVINEFNQSEQKDTAIRNLARKYNVTQYQIIELLRKYHVDKIPKILSRSEALEISDVKKKRDKDIIEFEKNVQTSVSINKRFEEMEWMFRWERQEQVFDLIEEYGSMTVKELSDVLLIEIKSSDKLLRHYNKNGYLTRSKNLSKKFSYELSDKGINQLNGFLRNGLYLNY